MMKYDDKYDYDDHNDNLDVLLTMTFYFYLTILLPHVIFYLFYYSAILATTPINACVLAGSNPILPTKRDNQSPKIVYQITTYTCS